MLVPHLALLQRTPQPPRVQAGSAGGGDGGGGSSCTRVSRAVPREVSLDQLLEASVEVLPVPRRHAVAGLHLDHSAPPHAVDDTHTKVLGLTGLVVRVVL